MRLYHIKTIGILLTLFNIVSLCEAQELKQVSTDTDGFQYLKVENKAIHSLHKIKHSLLMPDDFETTEILRHTPAFNEHPFNVSAIAVYNTNQIIMVHAEAVTDSSHYLNYSYLKSTRLNCMKFYTKETCVVISDDLLSQAVDLKFFQEEGFDFSPAIYLKQFFQYSEDGNYEYVLSYGEKVADCSETTVNKSFKKHFVKRLKNTVEFEK